MEWFHDDIVCRSCGKKYKYRAWANKHFWNCPTPNDNHQAERVRHRWWDRKFLEQIKQELAFIVRFVG